MFYAAISMGCIERALVDCGVDEEARPERWLKDILPPENALAKTFDKRITAP
jgi:hypothetical protein